MNDVNSSDQRRHPRLKHRAKIRVIVPIPSKVFMADMRDFSESGLFLIISSTDVVTEVGALVEVQTTEFDDAPIQTARVVRVEPGVGVAVEFIMASSSTDIES